MPQISLKYKALLASIAVISTALLGPSLSVDAASLSKKDTAQYKAAFKAAKAGKWTAATRHAARAKDPLPAKVLSWLRFSTQGSGATFQEIDDFLTANPDWPRRASLRRRAEETMKAALQDTAALAWFAKEAPRTTAGAIRYGNALLAKGQRQEATRYIREAWRTLDMARPDERSFYRSFRNFLRKEDNVARLDRLIWDQRVGAARRQMRRVSRDQQHLAQARLMLMRRTGGVDGAIARVPSELQVHPGLVFERMRWRRRKGFTDRAVELLKHPPAQLIRPAKWWQERAILSRRALAEGDITTAYRLAQGHSQTKGSSLAEAEWLSGWIALRYLRDYDVARRHFQRLFKTVRYPISRARGAYWTARAIEENPADIENRRTQAMQWYRAAARFPTTFYGQLAIDRLSQQRNTRPPTEPAPSAAEMKQFEDRELVRATRLLAHLGQNKLVKTFVLRLTPLAKRPAEWALIGRLATDLNRNDLAIRVAKLAIRKGVTLTAAGYPKLNVRRDFSVEPALMHAVIRQESAFDTKAISRAGARGLMQLMPATARQVARQLKVRHNKQKLLTDPVHNLRLGSAYLDHLRENYDGSLILAVAAYNAGPGNVNRWIRLNGDPREFSTFDAIDWIESIPFSETRNYVQRVLENMTVYGYRFESSFLPEMLVDAMVGSDMVDYH